MSLTTPIYGPNDLELDLIYRLSGLEPPSIHTHNKPETNSDLHLPHTGNRIQTVLGRANSPALNQVPVSRNLVCL